MDEIYKKLAEHLDNTPGGFPSTESGVELRILRRLFTEEQAELALNLFMMPEPPEAIAERAGMDPEKVRTMLADMSRKGLIIHSSKGGADLYMQAQFVIGIWEYQVNSLTRELIEDFNEYVPYLMESQEKQKTKQLRVIPVSEAINADMEVTDYEKAEKLIKEQSKIVLAPCICRKEHQMVGKGCGKPIETCLVFGGGAYFYEERGIGRTITQKEALEVLDKGIEHGLVLQPGNAQKPLNICMCCDCCCQILRNIKNSDRPALLVNTNYRARVDEDACTACEVCSEICPMDAVTVDESARIDPDRCIGCGLCVGNCEFDAVELELIEPSARWEPPKNTVETYMAIARERGLM